MLELVMGMIGDVVLGRSRVRRIRGGGVVKGILILSVLLLAWLGRILRFWARMNTIIDLANY